MAKITELARKKLMRAVPPKEKAPVGPSLDTFSAAKIRAKASKVLGK